MTDTGAPPALWSSLRRFTSARVALGRAGRGLPTGAHLAFQAAHAATRDAVHASLDVPGLAGDLTALGINLILVASACPDRRTYLLRPDLGRSLAEPDRNRLAATSAPGTIAFVICDGLSAIAVRRHAAPLLAHVLPSLSGLPAGPVVIATQGRVALGDEIGEALRAAAVAVLIGERPGLSTPESMGIYLTWQPHRGRLDSERNCISNIHADGLAIDRAASKLVWLIDAMRRLGRTGIDLKDEQPLEPLDRTTPRTLGGSTGSGAETAPHRDDART